MARFAMGDRVAGTYLRREVKGTVSNIDFARAPDCVTYTVKLDVPVRVTDDDSPMNFTRLSVTVNLNEDGQSVDTKNRPDKIAHLAKLSG